MKSYKSLLSLVFTVILLGEVSIAIAQQKAPPPITAAPISDFIGVEYINGTPSALLVSIQRYGKEAVTVDFIGAVHVADASLYVAHQEQFKQYEALLFEGVKPAGAPTAKQSPFDLLGMLYQQSSQQMQLAQQSQYIERADNFIHSDVTDVELAQAWRQAMSEQGETQLTLLAGAGLELLRSYVRAQAVQESDGSLGKAFQPLSQPQRPLDLKRQSVVQLAKGGLPGDALGSFGRTLNGLFQKSIVDFRNRRAVDTLVDELKADKRTVGIYWGAAHGPGIDFMLRTELGFERRGTKWLVAWDMKEGLGEVTPPFPLPAK